MKDKLEKFFKLLTILSFGYPLYFISFLFPRTKKRWVFGSGNSFSDNAKYLFLDIIENHKDIDAAWISKNRRIVKDLCDKKLPAFYIYSLEGIKYLLTSNVYCLSNYPSITKDISLPLWTMGRAKYIQMWHGVGVKKVLFARDNDLTANRIKHPIKKYFWLPITYTNILQPNLFLSTSKEMSTHFQKCFRLRPESIVHANYPRCQIFKPKQRKEYLSKYACKSELEILNLIKKYNKSLIYMPTFREENLNYLDDAGFSYEKLNKKMKEINALFIFKLHPWSKVTLNNKTTFSNILFLDANIDIYPILPATDVLITDYSSIYYDYLLISNKDTIFFDYDREEYINERDFAFDYDECTNGIKIKTFDDLLTTIEMRNHKQINHAKNQKLIEFFWGFPEDKKDLVLEIKNLEN